MQSLAAALTTDHPLSEGNVDSQITTDGLSVDRAGSAWSVMARFFQVTVSRQQLNRETLARGVSDDVRGALIIKRLFTGQGGENLVDWTDGLVHTLYWVEWVKAYHGERAQVEDRLRLIAPLLTGVTYNDLVFLFYGETTPSLYVLRLLAAFKSQGIVIPLDWLKDPTEGAECDTFRQVVNAAVVRPDVGPVPFLELISGYLGDRRNTIVTWLRRHDFNLSDAKDPEFAANYSRFFSSQSGMRPTGELVIGPLGSVTGGGEWVPLDDDGVRGLEAVHVEQVGDNQALFEQVMRDSGLLSYSGADRLRQAVPKPAAARARRHHSSISVGDIETHFVAYLRARHRVTTVPDNFTEDFAAYLESV